MGTGVPMTTPNLIIIVIKSLLISFIKLIVEKLFIIIIIISVQYLQ